MNSIETYFLSDNLYSNETQLVNKHEFSLYVCDFNSIINETDTNLLEIINDPNQQLILDVDLDFFSTLDPFKRMFKTTDEFEEFTGLDYQFLRLINSSKTIMLNIY